MQDVFLFAGTIRENIRLYNPEITPEQIEEVARHVNAHHFIDKLPKKYDEPVTEKGSTSLPARGSSSPLPAPWRMIRYSDLG